MSNTITPLLVLLLIFLPFVTPANFKASVVLSSIRNWIPLGKFTQRVPPVMRARMVSGTGLKATQKADLYIISYLPEKWQSALEGKNCTARLEQMFEQHIIRVPMDASWSDWVNISFPHPTVYLVASDCFSTYALEPTGHLTEIELKGCTYEPIPESELNMTPAVLDRAPKQDVPHEKFESMSRRFGVKSFSIVALIVLVLCLVGTQVIYDQLFKREFLFGFPMLIISVGLRIIMHMVLIIEAMMPSRFLYNAVLFMDVLSQFGFTVHVIATVLGYPLGPIAPTIINGALTALIFVILGISSTPYPIIVLRGLLALILIGCYIYGIRNTTQAKGLKTMTFITGLIYLLGMIAIGVALMLCSEISSILLNRIELLMGSTKCPQGGYWIIESDFLFQGIMMGITLIVSGYVVNKH